MAARMEELWKKLIDEAVDGLGLWILGKATEYIKPYSVKTLREWNDPAVKIAVSLVDLVVPQIKTLPYVGDWLGLVGRRGVEELLGIVVDKRPVCHAVDENTLRCVNFDTTAVAVKIDGAAVTPTISGTPEELTISLATPLAKGAHDLVVTGDRKSFAGKIYV